MSIIQAVYAPNGEAKDVICDIDGRLLVGGISLTGDVAIDLTDTNTRLDSLIDILDPPGGTPFEVRIPADQPITINSTTPLNVNLSSITNAAFPDGIPIRIESADDTVNVNVEVAALDPIAFADGFPINITGIDIGGLTSIPISIEAISNTAFPDGLEVKLTGLDATVFPDGLNVNVTGSTEPLLVQIDTTGGPSVVTLDATQFNDLLNNITVSSETTLVDSLGDPIGPGNPLEVAFPVTDFMRIGNEIGLLSDTNPLYVKTDATEITFADDLTGSTNTGFSQLTYPVVNFDRRSQNAVGGAESFRTFVSGMPKYNGMVGSSITGPGGFGGSSLNPEGYFYNQSKSIADTALHTMSGALVIPEVGLPVGDTALGGDPAYIDHGVSFLATTTTAEPTVFPLTQSHTGDLFTGYRADSYYDGRTATPVDIATPPITRWVMNANTAFIIGRVLPNSQCRVGAMSGHIVVHGYVMSGMVGTTAYLGVEWNACRDTSDPDFDLRWTTVAIDTSVSASNLDLYMLLNESLIANAIRVPIMGRYCRVVYWTNHLLGPIPSPGVISARIDVHRAPY